jgi:hypothetical protein
MTPLGIVPTAISALVLFGGIAMAAGWRWWARPQGDRGMRGGVLCHPHRRAGDWADQRFGVSTGSAGAEAGVMRRPGMASAATAPASDSVPLTAIDAVNPSVKAAGPA